VIILVSLRFRMYFNLQDAHRDIVLLFLNKGSKGGDDYGKGGMGKGGKGKWFGLLAFWRLCLFSSCSFVVAFAPYIVLIGGMSKSGKG
jgi:hypothetical protein